MLHSAWLRSVILDPPKILLMSSLRGWKATPGEDSLLGRPTDSWHFRVFGAPVPYSAFLQVRPEQGLGGNYQGGLDPMKTVRQ